MNKWQRFCVIFGGVSGMVSVLMGAAAAHWLQNHLTAKDIATIEKAAAYEMYHALALIALAALMMQWPKRAFTLAAIFFAVGILCFSGSLYAYAFTHMRVLVWITPIGGLSFMAGWLCLVWGGVSSARKPTAT